MIIQTAQKTFQGSTGDFTVAIERNRAKDTDTHKAYTYSLTTPNGDVLFGDKNKDRFGVSIYSDFTDDEDRLLYLALDCATIRPGDTDEYFFDGYTAAELAFANSYDCEYLQSEVSDYERGYCEL